MRATCGESRKIGICPKCKTKLLIPTLSEIEARKSQRAVIGESKFQIALPEALTTHGEAPDCRVMYTEASPYEFALRRKDRFPVLDLSEGGLSFFIRTTDAKDRITLGKTILVEIDFPVLVVPIYAYAAVRWVNSTDDRALLQVGVEFEEESEDLRRIVAGLMGYVLSKPDVWEPVELEGDDHR